MNKSAFCLVILFCVAGCQRKGSPVADAGTSYKYASIQGPSVDAELAFYRERVAQTPKSGIYQANLAGAYLAKAQFAGDSSFYLLAEQAAQESLKILPDSNPGATIILASVNEARHEFEKAYEQAKSVYDQQKDSLDARSIMASSLLELGRLPESLKFSEDIAKQFPTSASLMTLARCKMVLGEDDEARKILHKCLQIEQPGERKLSARIRSLLGEIETREGHPQAAESYFKAALEAQNTHFPALIGLAKLEERAGHSDAAIQWYTQAFTFTQNPTYLTEVAHLKAKAGDAAGAEELSKKAESMLRPEIEKRRFGHARDLARILLDRGDEASVKEAISILENETKQRGDVKLYEILGEAYYSGGDLDKSREAFKKALSTGIREPALWARLAKVDEKQGHADEAKSDMAKALAIDPGFQAAWVER